MYITLTLKRIKKYYWLYTDIYIDIYIYISPWAKQTIAIPLQGELHVGKRCVNIMAPQTHHRFMRIRILQAGAPPAQLPRERSGVEAIL